MPSPAYPRHLIEKGVPVLDFSDWPGHTARRMLGLELQKIHARGGRGRSRPADDREASEIRRGLLDLDASYRALLRWELEGCSDSRDLYRLQADENVVAGLPLNTISPEGLEAARKKFPGWAPGDGCYTPGQSATWDYTGDTGPGAQRNGGA